MARAGSTLQLPPISRPLSIPAFSRDVASTHGRSPSRAAAFLREPRAAIVLAAHEAITEAPLTAPMKLAAEVPAPAAPVARPRPQPQPVRSPPPPPPPARRPGFQRPSNLPLPAPAHR